MVGAWCHISPPDLQNELRFEDVVELNVPGVFVDGPDGSEVTAVAAGTCFDFNATNKHLYIVGMFGIQVYVRTYVCAHLSIQPSVCPSNHPSVHPTIRLSIQPSVCPSNHPSVHPTIRLSIHSSDLYHNRTLHIF